MGYVILVELGIARWKVVGYELLDLFPFLVCFKFSLKAIVSLGGPVPHMRSGIL